MYSLLKKKLFSSSAILTVFFLWFFQLSYADENVNNCDIGSPNILPLKFQAEHFCTSDGVKLKSDLPDIENEAIVSFGKNDFVEYRIESPSTDRYLMTLNVATRKTAEIEVFIDGRSVTLFSIPPTGGSKSFASKSFSFNLPAGESRLKLRGFSGSTSIDWISFVKDFTVVESQLKNGQYSIINKQTLKSLDVQDWSSNNGGNIQQWEYGLSANQRWQLLDQGQNEYEIISLHSKKCLDLDMSTGNIQQWECTKGSNQRWILESIAPGLFLIKNSNRGSVISVFEGARYDGVNIESTQFAQKMHQVWLIEAVR